MIDQDSVHLKSKISYLGSSTGAIVAPRSFKKNLCDVDR